MVFLSSNIKEIREESELTQKEVEDSLGLTRGVVSSYEKGTSPRLKILVDLVNLFKIEYPKLTIDLLLNQDLTKMDLNQFKESNEIQVQTGIGSINGYGDSSLNENKDRILQVENIALVSQHKGISKDFLMILADKVAFK